MTEKIKFEDYFNTPNLISYSRVILLLPIVLVYPNRWLMLGLFGIAAISDWYDDYVAKKQKLTNRLGAIIDPLCDKILFAGVVLFFYGKGDLNMFQLITLFVRDLFVLGLISFTSILTIYDRKLKKLKHLMKARITGKITTVLIFIAVFWVMTGIPGFEYYIFTVLLSSSVTIIDYSIDYGNNMLEIYSDKLYDERSGSKEHTIKNRGRI